MTKRIFRAIFITAVSIFFASVVLFMMVLYDYFSNMQHYQLKMQTDLAAQGIKDEGMQYLEGLTINDYRITWIGTDGKVLYDSISNADQMENHFEREEIKEALSKGYGESTRYSSTLTERYLYSAKRLPDGTIIRLSIAQNSLLTLFLGMLQPLCIIFAIAIILSFVFAFHLSKSIVKPLNELDLDAPLDNNGYDELSPLLRRINIQQRQIREQSDELHRKQSEFEAVTRGMTEGIILLNNKGIILSINDAAAKLLDTDDTSVGKDILTVNRSLELTKLLYKSRNGQYSEMVIDLGNNKYQFCASPVVSDNVMSGTVLLLFDVTEKEKNEQMRREFTANVSHELKTPLHTISGSAELMANGIVKSEDIIKFSKQIYSESQRMIHLVEDIIKLSHLDEGAKDMKREKVDLYLLASETVQTLLSKAENSNIKIELGGESATIYGIPQLLQSIIYNLCDNAIKYNHEEGSVSVIIKDDDNYVNLSVVDTGIGIPAKDQERIFERFYRVDKSHSKEIGGTGLGLSIVKHAARLHNAQIELHSLINEGTTITIRFPKNKKE